MNGEALMPVLKNLQPRPPFEVQETLQRKTASNVRYKILLYLQKSLLEEFLMRNFLALDSNYRQLQASRNVHRDLFLDQLRSPVVLSEGSLL